MGCSPWGCKELDTTCDLMTMATKEQRTLHVCTSVDRRAALVSWCHYWSVFAVFFVFCFFHCVSHSPPQCGTRVCGSV